MKSIGQLLLGLVTALISITLVVSAVSQSLVEGRSAAVAALTLEPTAEPSYTPEPPLEITLVVTATVPEVESTRAAAATATEVQPTACPAPRAWKPYEVQPGDTLEDLALQTGATVEEIRKANCLTASSLMPGTTLNLPLKPTPTVNAPSTPTPLPTVAATFLPTTCGLPLNWARYVVQPGDTLFRLGLAVGLTADALRTANCLASDRINVGQILYLPFIPVYPVPTSTFTPTFTATTRPSVPTASRTAVPPSPTPVTPSPTPVTPSPTPVTPSPTPVTPSPTPVTPSPTSTPISPSTQ